VTPPVPMRLCLVSPEVVLGLDGARVRPLFAAYDATPPRPREPMALARALWGRPVPWRLADALDELARLGTPAGRDALVEAARSFPRAHDGWEDEAPVDLAARLLSNPIQEHAVLLRAHLRLARLPPERPTYELRGAGAWAGAQARELPAGAARSLAVALREVAGGPWSELWVQEEEGGLLHAVLLYAAPADAVCGVAGRRGPAPRVAQRALRADAFCLRIAEGRLLVTTARPQRLEAYAAAWGRALRGDARFFSLEPSITLRPLQARYADGIPAGALAPGVVRARVVACQLDTGEAERLEARGPRALAKLAPHLRAGGQLTRATIRFDVAGEQRPVEATLALPHRFDLGATGVAGAGSRAARIVRDAVAKLGLLSPGAMADDVTTLLPLVHPEWRWREIVGAEALAGMRAGGLLDHVAGEETRRPATERLRALGRSAVAFALFRPVAGGGAPPDPAAPKHVRDLVNAVNEATRVLRKVTGYYVVPDDWAFPATTLDLEEMQMLRLDLAAVARKGRRELGLERGERPRLPKGVLWIGEMRVDSGAVKWFYVVRAAVDDRDRAALGKAIARATGFGRAVVLVPEGRRLGRDFVEVELGVREQLGAASWRGKMAEAVAELGIEEEVPPERLVGDGVRVVVDTKRERVVLDGVPLLKMGESGYRLVKALAAKGPGAVVSRRETDAAISGARMTEGATRNTVWKMKGWIRESFELAGRRVPEDVEREGLVRAVGKRGWTLEARAVVR